MEVGDDPARQRLYVELVKTLAVRAYRFGFEAALPRTPRPEFLEEGTVVIEMRTLRETLLPTEGASFSHGASSPYEIISHILHSVGLTGRTPTEVVGMAHGFHHISKFLVDHEATDSFLADSKAWRAVPLEEVVGGYFAIYGHEDMLTEQAFWPRRGEEDIIALFAEAGFMERLGYRYRWNEDILKAHISHEMWFPGGIPEFDDDEE